MRGALRKFVANRAPNLRNAGGFVSYIRGRVREIVANFVANLKVNFGQFYEKKPFSNAPFPKSLSVASDTRLLYSLRIIFVIFDIRIFFKNIKKNHWFLNLDGPAIRNANRGDVRESIRAH